MLLFEEDDFERIVWITFTSLILRELLMVTFEMHRVRGGVQAILLRIAVYTHAFFLCCS